MILALEKKASINRHSQLEPKKEKGVRRETLAHAQIVLQMEMKP